MKNDDLKYNPLEIDEGGWIPKRSSHPVSITKSCWFCTYAPAIAFIFIDIYGGYHGHLHQIGWLIFQLLFASMYVSNNEKLFERKEDGKIQWSTSGIMLVLMLGITLRAILFILLLS